MDQPLFLDGLSDLVRVLTLAPLLYCAVIVFIRISGKRTTAQMNNFDWIVTVALGSLMASPILIDDVTLAETLLAIACLIGLQWGVTTLVPKIKWFARAVKAEPSLLVREGIFLDEALSRERVTRGEVASAIRGSGLDSLEDVRWVILESDATMSVIARADGGRPATAMAGVAGFTASPEPR